MCFLLPPDETVLADARSSLGGDCREREDTSGVLQLPPRAEQLWELVMGEGPHDPVTVDQVRAAYEEGYHGWS